MPKKLHRQLVHQKSSQHPLPVSDHAPSARRSSISKQGHSPASARSYAPVSTISSKTAPVHPESGASAAADDFFNPLNRIVFPSCAKILPSLRRKHPAVVAALSISFFVRSMLCNHSVFQMTKSDLPAVQRITDASRKSTASFVASSTSCKKSSLPVSGSKMLSGSSRSTASKSPASTCTKKRCPFPAEKTPLFQTASAMNALRQALIFFQTDLSQRLPDKRLVLFSAFPQQTFSRRSPDTAGNPAAAQKRFFPIPVRLTAPFLYSFPVKSG